MEVGTKPATPPVRHHPPPCILPWVQAPPVIRRTGDGFCSALQDIWRGTLGINELVGIAVLASFASSDYKTAGVVAFFMLMGEILETHTAQRARDAIESLIKLTPTKARRLTAQGEEEVAAKDLAVGDMIRIRPGDNVAADGVIVSGQGSFNQANITGESLPVDKKPGDEVFAGTQNLTGVLEVKVSRAGHDTTLGRVRDLILAAENSQALFALREALHWLDRAVAIAESHPESVNVAQRLAIYEHRGVARVQAGQTQGAVADMCLVIDVLRASGEREKTRDALIQLGMAYRRADHYEQATECLTEALEESRKMNDEGHAADTLYHLGTVAWSSGINDQAIAYHQQAVEICERTGFADLVAVQAYHGRGEAHFANAEPEAAIVCYTRSLELARSIGDKSYESENIMMIGHACLGTKGLGDYPRAIASFESALDIARSADLQWHLGPTLIGLDHARASTGG